MKPLTGLRVVDASQNLAGARVSGFLADYGAQVLVVERPGGDPTRRSDPTAWSVFNRGKSSIELDLHDPGGQCALLQLLDNADVLIESAPPSHAAEVGLAPAQLGAAFPHLVHVSITGFGPDGPLADVAAREALVHALVGTMGEQVGHRDGPIYEGVPFASIGAAWLAIIGLLAVLVRRDDDGRGRHVETSLYDGAVAFLGMMWGDSDAHPSIDDHMTMDGFFPSRAIRQITGFFRCADDLYLGVHTGAVGGFGRLMAVLGFDDRIAPVPPETEVGTPLTMDERSTIAADIHDIFASEPRDTWLKRLLEADVCGIPCGRPGDAFDEPQLAANGLLVTIDDATLGRTTQVGPPIRLGSSVAQLAEGAPRAAGSIAPWADLRAEHPWCGDGPLDSSPPLSGLRILDLGVYYAGPSASRHLADLGADVIKLETVAGDPLRGLPRLFRGAQAGKRSVAADLKDPDLNRLRDRLVTWADVVHHNMRPGVAERLGVGSAQVASLSPGTIYGYSPGWGSSGPLATHQSFEPMMSGFVGIGFEVAGRFNEPVYPAGNADAGNGLIGAAAILLALLHRRRTGEAVSFECPQVNAALTLLAHISRSDDVGVLGAETLDPLQLGRTALDRLYETSDGWVCVVARGSREVRGLSECLSLDLLGDERFATAEGRAEHDAVLEALLADAISTQSTEQLVTRLEAAGVPCAVPLPRNGHRFLNDPESHRTGRAVDIEDPIEGRVRAIGRLMRIADVNVTPYRLAPALGEHTAAILADCGYGPEQIEALRARGAITVHDRRAHA